MKKLVILLFLISCALPAFAGGEYEKFHFYQNKYNETFKQYDNKEFLKSKYDITFAEPTYEYKPIPKELQAQYKAEIEAYIDKQIPIAKKEIKKEVKKAEKLYKQFLKKKNRNLKEVYLEQLNEIGVNVGFTDAAIYLDLINITNKYVDIENLIPATGFVQELDLFMNPYLEINKIHNKNKLLELYHFSYYEDQKVINIIESVSWY